jgi:hypothetical protein
MCQRQRDLAKVWARDICENFGLLKAFSADLAQSAVEATKPTRINRIFIKSRPHQIGWRSITFSPKVAVRPSSSSVQDEDASATDAVTTAMPIG